MASFEAGTSPDNYKRAEICRQRMGPVLRRITMNFPPLLFHPINSITAYKGQIIYDTPETEAKAQTPVPYLQWQPAPGVTPPTVSAGRGPEFVDVPPPGIRSTSHAGGAGSGRAGPDCACAGSEHASACAAARRAASRRGWRMMREHVVQQGITGRPANGGPLRRVPRCWPGARSVG